MINQIDLAKWPSGLPTSRKECGYCGRTLPCIRAEDPYRTEKRAKDPKLAVQEVLWCQLCWDLRIA